MKKKYIRWAVFYVCVVAVLAAVFLLVYKGIASTNERKHPRTSEFSIPEKIVEAEYINAFEQLKAEYVMEQYNADEAEVCAVVGDFNNDGLNDVYMTSASIFQESYFCVRQEDGSFKRLSEDDMTALTNAGSGAWWRSYYHFRDNEWILKYINGGRVYSDGDGNELGANERYVCNTAYVGKYRGSHFEKFYEYKYNGKDDSYQRWPDAGNNADLATLYEIEIENITGAGGYFEGTVSLDNLANEVKESGNGIGFFDEVTGKIYYAK
ncbi:MAG: hypothetical protein MJ107_03810 [Lachnospiraceae bacterium]|nr:hypothetical protein [Lachnospiraceae bacterium]